MGWFFSGMCSCLFVVCLAGCGNPRLSCDDLVGTHSGSLSGSGNYNGTLTLVVSSQGPMATEAKVEGTWNGEDGYFGDVRLVTVTCADGTLKDANGFGFQLKGPTSVICPSPCAPTDNDGGCYCTGVTLGGFAGKLSATGGSGTWKADSGAAQTVGATGSGAWTVTKSP